MTAGTAPRLITEVPKGEKVDDADMLREYLLEFATPEVLNGGLSSSITIDDIEPIAEHTHEHTGAKQSLIQVIEAGGELFGVVATDSNDEQKLELIRISVPPISLGDISDEAITIGREAMPDKVFLVTFSKSHFEISVSPEGVLFVKDLVSTNGTTVRTIIKPDQIDLDKPTNPATLAELNRAAKMRQNRGNFAPGPKLPSKILDGSSWAVQ